MPLRKESMGTSFKQIFPSSPFDPSIKRSETESWGGGHFEGGEEEVGVQAFWRSLKVNPHGVGALLEVYTWVGGLGGGHPRKVHPFYFVTPRPERGQIGQQICLTHFLMYEPILQAKPNQSNHRPECGISSQAR